MRSEDEVRNTAAGIADTLASIEAGTLESTKVQRAFLAGALDALLQVLEDAPVDGGGDDSRPVHT